ncbi:MAG: 4-alpha-glucanotransferase, partial [bacterium]|nr:4-alpha-glucanotransferase [bacterium]
MSRRRAGVLAHPTSLPGPFGVGDVGPSALAFCDWVAAAGQTVWQILPVGPTGQGHSPYACLSAFAGNPLLISPEWLQRRSWLPREALARAPAFPVKRVDFGRAETWKRRLLQESWGHFKSCASRESKRELERFVEAPEQACWLGDWSMFAALKERFAGRAWFQWDPDLKCRQPGALRAAAAELADAIAYQRYLQFVFFRQWTDLRRHARSQGIELLGDVPIYVAHDSVDVWAHPELFQLDEDRNPIKVAGVPPDYFSETGQLWGNPLYRWDRMAEDGYAWWVDRLKATLRTADRVRLDHFRGFAAYWEVDAYATTAEHGQWVAGPGLNFFRELESALGGLPFVAEDLGVITDDVRELRRELELPGMRVLQFALGDDDNEHRPDNHTPDSVVYTGTHDNDTAR